MVVLNVIMILMLVLSNLLIWSMRIIRLQSELFNIFFRDKVMKNKEKPPMRQKVDLLRGNSTKIVYEHENTSSL